MLFDILFPETTLSPALRAGAAAATAACVAVAAGRPVVGWLRTRKLRDGACRKASATLAHLHAEAGKAATPTMGGLVILLALFVSVLAWGPLAQPAVFVGLGLVLAFAAIGALDDWAKLNRRANGDGLRGRTKLLLEVALALVAVLALAALAQARTELVVPLLGVTLELGPWYLAFAALVIVGSANATNLSDGLDGLASGVVGLAATALGMAALLGAVALTVALPPPPQAELAVFAAALAGACFGFLWHNRHPARVFMGDTGSLAIGAGLGFAAVLMQLEVLLLLAGGVLVLEALSVMLQVASFKLTGKRIFRCAPIHHHFQFKGWSEKQVVTRFWLAGALLAVASVASHLIVAT